MDPGSKAGMTLCSNPVRDDSAQKQEEIALLKSHQTSAEHAANVHRLRCRWAKGWASQHRQLSDSRDHISAWIQMAGQVVDPYMS